MIRLKLILLSLILFSIQSFSQIEGLWEVESVSAEGQEMTPQAKWFDLQNNRQLLSGNGGLINNRGTWSYDKAQTSLLFLNANGEADPAGAFQVKWKATSMEWVRQEEGMRINIALKRVERIPFANWDYIVGNWKIDQVFKNDQEVSEQLNPNKDFSLFVRWDHLFVGRNDLEGRQQHWGVWQIHSHKAELRLMSLDSKEGNELWQIHQLDDQNLILSKEAEGVEMKLVFSKGE